MTIAAGALKVALVGATPSTNGLLTPDCPAKVEMMPVALETSRMLVPAPIWEM